MNQRVPEWMKRALNTTKLVGLQLKRRNSYDNLPEGEVMASEATLTARAKSQIQQEDRRLVPDYGWAQVMRFGSDCNAAVDGLSAGFEGDCGENYTKIGRPELATCDPSQSKDIGYGCWFFFSEGRSLDPMGFGGQFKVVEGSGVAVNVGKSLRVDTRAEASAALGLDCADPPLCEKPKTMQDKLYCEKAVALGYDSIQMALPHMSCLTEKCQRTRTSSIRPNWSSVRASA